MLCISLVGVLYTIIFAGILLRMPDVNADQRRSSTNSALGYSFLVVPLLVFLVLLTNKMDETVKISYFAAASPLFLTFFTLIITSFGSRGKLNTDLKDQEISLILCRRQPVLVRTAEATVSVPVLGLSVSSTVRERELQPVHPQ